MPPFLQLETQLAFPMPERQVLEINDILGTVWIVRLSYAQQQDISAVLTPAIAGPLSLIQQLGADLPC
jgi:hypothetical protein